MSGIADILKCQLYLTFALVTGRVLSAYLSADGIGHQLSDQAEVWGTANMLSIGALHLYSATGERTLPGTARCGDAGL